MWIRTTNKCNAPPDWAPPCTSFTLLTDGGALCCTHDQIGGAPADGWVDAGDGWELRLLDGEIPEPRATREDPDGIERLCTPDGTWCPMQPVLDLMGSGWVVPMVFRPDGHCMLQTKLVMVDGLPERIPTPLQERIKRAAKYFLELTDEYANGAPPECEIACAAELIAAGHYISTTAMLTSGLMDDHLITRIWIASIGGTVQDG